MKRIIALILALILLSSSLITASAQVDEEKLLQDYIQYMETTYNSKYEPAPWVGAPGIDKVVESDGVVFFSAHSWHLTLTAGILIIIGDWFYHNNSIEKPNGLALLVQKDGVIYDLETAYNKGIITDLSPTVEFDGFQGRSVYPIGDADGNHQLNIKDATAIQKHLADMDTELVCEEYRKIIMDSNMDEEINIKDATFIQKKLANLK